MLNKKTFIDLQAEAVEYLLNNTNITMVSTGSVARTIIDVLNQQLAEFYDTLDTDMAMTFVSTSSGFFLDLIAKLFGLTRKTPQKVTVLEDDRNIKFFVSSGALAAQLPHPTDPGLGRVPSGTTLNNGDGSVVYTVTQNFDFPSTARHAFVSAISTLTGVKANIGANQLTSNSIANALVLSTNVSTISSGSAQEEDDAFRARIVSTATAAETSNATAVRLAALGAPGVAEVELRPFVRGSGSVDVFIIPIGNRVPQASLEAIRNRIEAVGAYGISFEITEPDYIPIDIEATIRFGSTTLDGAKEVGLNLAEQAVLGYIGNIRPGGELIISQVQSIIINSSPLIKDVNITFLCINGRAQLIRNFKLEEDEVFIPDEDVPNPVVVRT